MPAAYEYSFIVPVYNAEKHLAECLDSLVNQGERCEFVLVDDGSTDSSGKICDAYAESCERVRVFHRPNAGLPPHAISALNTLRARTAFSSIPTILSAQISSKD